MRQSNHNKKSKTWNDPRLYQNQLNCLFLCREKYSSGFKILLIIALLHLVWSYRLCLKKDKTQSIIQLDTQLVLHSEINANISHIVINSAPAKSLFQPRFDWTKLEPQSTLAKNISRHQQNLCNLPLSNFRYRNRFGLGSDLHVWSQAICNGMEMGVRVRTKMPWIWLDTEACTKKLESTEPLGESFHTVDNRKGKPVSSMTCYFPRSELNCPGDVRLSMEEDVYGRAIAHNLTHGKGRIRNECPALHERYGISEIRAAAMEFLFSGVGEIVQQETQRQLEIVFGNISHVPKNLITVHIRWGDKKSEMKLVPIREYVNAVSKLIQERRFDKDGDDSVSIFLATEDPLALQEFQEAAPKEWTIYVDAYYQELLQYRRDGYNGSPQMSSALNGKPGLIALGSLLVSMEANYFVLTTASNWSRLINELRTNVLDPRCGNCTKSIDLRHGSW